MARPLEESNLQATKAYYDLGKERERLSGPNGSIEFERTKDVLQRFLPPPPAIIADIGGGPGRYALWLAERGYQVYHRDLIGLHVQQLQGDLLERASLSIDTAVADARQLDLADASVDA